MKYKIAVTRSFNTALNSIKVGEYEKVMAQIRAALRVSTNYNAKQHARGELSTHPEDLKKVEKIFASIGITPCFDDEL